MTTYTTDLRRIAHAMATAQSDGLSGDLESGSRLDMLKDFVNGNFDKRLDKLDKALGLVKEVLADEFEELLVAYIKATPLAAYDSGQYDGERFLQWLQANRELTPQQQDHVACQRARHAVEEQGRRHRLAHVRYQEMASMAEQLADELPTNQSLEIHLNPLRVWSRFETTALLDEEDSPPADVLFYPVGNEVTTVVLEEDGRALIEELARLSPCTLETWSVLSEHADREELQEFAADLAALGLVAFR